MHRSRSPHADANEDSKKVDDPLKGKTSAIASWPYYSEAEIEAVVNVLKSGRVNYWTGTIGREFEKRYAKWAGSRFAIAVANGTVALDLALRAIRVGAGDEVIVSPRTFVATASSVALLGGIPVFADVDRDSQNITAETISKVITPRTKAIICVHIGGMPCDMDPIMAVAEQHGIKVIEDCAQAHGATYKGRSVGSLGDIGAWSFCQDKIITTGGEGGMLTTDSEEYWSAMWSFKDHGKDWQLSQAKEIQPEFRWLHKTFGSNYRMLEMQAAIGLKQLDLLPSWHAKRIANAKVLASACRNLVAVRVPQVPDHVSQAFYRFYVFVIKKNLAEGWTRNRIVTEISAQGVPCSQGTCPEVYSEEAFATTGLRPSERLPIARELGETSIAFLVHPTMTDAELNRTAEVLKTVFSKAAG